MIMRKNRLKNLLKAYLDLNKLKLVPNSYDLVGHVAILDIPKELKKEKKLIAKVLLETNNHIKTVLQKASKREGEFRTRKYKFLAGKRKTETLHKEYGCIFKLDPTKVYFSPRELTERQRIAEQVKPKETVMVMFAGVGPYPIVIAKKQPEVKKIIAIEINPKAVKYMKENIRINKLSHKIIPIKGDVRDECKEWYGKCDRVVMPLPLGAESFLDLAVKCLKKKGGIIHFYNWGEEPDIFKQAKELVKKTMKKMKKKYKILKSRKVLPYAPRRWKVCLDIKVY